MNKYQIFGDYCHRCTRGLTGESVRLFSKGWCRQCYRCIACDKQLDHKDRVLEWDMRPMCKKCFYQKDFYKIVKQATKEEKNRSKVENK
uniref:LIM zinc-binding domain-containing protein n=1 Tax=Heterorhabditis bacteriophora TaxID=37862 RepID=A0A1I7WMZ5_HETBA